MASPRTVTISLPPRLAREVDRLARSERRSRSELFREAFRQYAARLERWERIFQAGAQAARRARVTEAEYPKMNATTAKAGAIQTSGSARPRRRRRLRRRGPIEVVTSARLMTELEDVLGRFGLAPEVAQAARNEYEFVALVVRPRRVPLVVRDPDDNEVLAAAVLGKADLVVTGDRDLLALGSHEGRSILTPRQFHEALEKRSPESSP